jgi:superfamily II RNA helicase
MLLRPPPPQDELLSTELLFRGVLSGMSPEEAVALMSALVFQVGNRHHFNH